MKYKVLTILLIVIFTTVLSGCNTQTTVDNNDTPVSILPSEQIQNKSSLDTVQAYGHVYREGIPIKGAKVEAVSTNRTYRESATTNDTGVYVLNLKPYVMYNITATYHGLKHTVWPVWLPGEIDTFNINLTTLPTSTIEGTGYGMGGPLLFPYNHTPMAGVEMKIRSVNDDTVVTALTDNTGYYCLKVKPNVLYYMRGNTSVYCDLPAQLYYRNHAGFDDYTSQIMVGPGETVFIGYISTVP